MKQVQQHLRFEELVANLASRLVNVSPDAVPDLLNKTLSELLDFFDVDRCALMELLPDKRQVRTSFASYRPGMTPQPEIIEMERDFPYLSRELLAGNVQTWETAKMPAEAGEDRASLSALDVRAFLIIPIAIGPSVTHLMGFNVARDATPWPDRYVPRLRMVGEMLVNTLVRSEADRERGITLRILSKASSAKTEDELLEGVTGLLQQWSGCEAVGIRMRRGDDFPYFETRGFPSRFIRAENRLCHGASEDDSFDSSDEPPLLDCLCGSVLTGQFDPQLPCFTDCGSFWTNSIGQLPDLAGRSMQRPRMRNLCEREGFESVALIPLSAGGETIGLLQFNDSRRGMFALGRITLFERLAYNIASAIARQRAVQALRESENRLRQEQVRLAEALQELEQLKERLRAENKYLREEIKGDHDFEEITGQSEPLRQTLRKIEHVADTDANVLLVGETGTGKELFARAIHSRSRRSGRPLVKVNCAALPAALIESELFGHMKGAFTGALADKIGRFQLAHGGTLFLDEIGELDLELQAKLLRVLQEGELERIGSNDTLHVDVRVIAATNRDLLGAMKEGAFRDDLYYRLAVFPIEIPPLRLRREDIPLLSWRFIEQKQARLGKRIESVPQHAMDALIQYHWPGNVRELENMIERAMILSSGPTLDLNGVFFESTRLGQPPAESPSSRGVDRAQILRVLDECGWKIKGTNNAAERLGLKPSTLRYRMKSLGIERPKRGS